MIIKTLMENTSNSQDLGSEHGLSLYIESKQHKLLFDTGASALFAENAVKMNVDLSAVDVTVISHGHYDHGGGLKTFLDINSKAKVYLNKKAFGKYYSNKPNEEKKYIGLDDALLNNDRFIFVGDRLVIDEEIELFSNVKGKRLSPSGNQDLFMKIDEALVHDDFIHEQNLIINENGKMLLVAGCAHNGIVNILEHLRTEKGCMPDYVIGGFHLYNRSTNQNESPTVVSEIGEYLLNTNAKYYTCHCTGLESYKWLKTVMGANIDYLSTGSQLII